MLDIKFIRENPDKIKQACQKKKVKCDLDRILELDKTRRELLSEIEELKAGQNKISGQGKPSSKRGKGDQKEIETARELKEKIRNRQPELAGVEEELNQLMLIVPNLISDDTPEGKDESDNQVLRKFKEPTKFDFKPKDHMELGVSLGLIDTAKAAKISGARFNYLFGGAVLMQFALIQFVLETLTDRKIIKKLAGQVGNPFDQPFLPVIPPVIAKAEIMKKMDRFDPIEDRYYLEQDDALLIGSAEHTMGPLHLNEIIDEKDLPIRYIGYSTAFRREAGSYGKDTAGILRRHQFDKAEIETFIQPEYGLVEQDLIVAIQEYLVQQLDIPYQAVALCSGDMGKPDFRQIDLECWMPGQNKYRETHTSDYMTDYQSRRLNTRVRRKDGRIEFVHMNDATALAIGRILIAILENYQQADGSVAVPEVLKKYLPDGMEKIGK
ncbi:serine--tRNA ligase [Patescibacteria group bacterium]|nr:serine--tRNA ligase [Patescibacteria group bacterium]